MPSLSELLRGKSVMKITNKDLTQYSEAELYKIAFELLYRSLNEIKIDEKILCKIYSECENREMQIYEKALFDAELSSDAIIIKRHEFLNPEEQAFYENTNHFELIESNNYKASDYFDVLKNLNIQKGNLLIITVKGDSMTGAGFDDGDLLYLDIGQKAINNNIVIAKLNGELFVKRLKIIEGSTWLYSENIKYNSYKVKSADEFYILGVVKSVSKKVF